MHDERDEFGELHNDPEHRYELSITTEILGREFTTSISRNHIFAFYDFVQDESRRSMCDWLCAQYPELYHEQAAHILELRTRIAELLGDDKKWRERRELCFELEDLQTETVEAAWDSLDRDPGFFLEQYVGWAYNAKRVRFVDRRPEPDSFGIRDFAASLGFPGNAPLE